MIHSQYSSISNLSKLIIFLVVSFIVTVVVMFLNKRHPVGHWKRQNGKLVIDRFDAIKHNYKVGDEGTFVLKYSSLLCDTVFLLDTNVPDYKNFRVEKLTLTEISY